MPEILTLTYIEATPGEATPEAAQRARDVGVECFLHNGRLYRLTAYALIGEVEPDTLRQASTKHR